VNRLVDKLARSEPAFGTFIALRDPAIVEILGWSGYDFAVFDFEHTQLPWDIMTEMVRAAEATGITPIARIGLRDYPLALQLVEAGVKGILAPHVTEPSHITDLIDVIRYRPHGDRGIDPSTRAARYGLSPMAERIEAPTEVMVFALIEDAAAIENIDAIARVPGLDAVMLGPSDLARSYDTGADMSHPAVREAIRRATEVLRSVGVPIWRAAFDRDTVEAARAEGVGMITSPPVDSLLVSQAFKNHLDMITAGG
jgi:2-keto-3-deoxy-L-rhamnonate aldolase RhmA